MRNSTKIVLSFFLVFFALFAFTACAAPALRDMPTDDASGALARLQAGNSYYTEHTENPAELTEAIRRQTSEQGQEPYAVVVSCSDSRVPVEHIFSAGIGELFIVRTAGNVLDDAALGSVEYGVEHLGAPLVVVMGHTQCGAVAATLEGGATGNIKSITDSISRHIGDESDPSACEMLNAAAVAQEIQESPVIEELLSGGGVMVVSAIYDISNGVVTFE